MRTRARAVVVLLALAAAASCTRFGPVYPPRPSAADAPPVADPPPSRVVAHLAVTSAALRAALDEAVPHEGAGTVKLSGFLGGERAYSWKRGPLDLELSQGRLALRTTVQASVSLPFRSLDVPLDVRVSAEPVMTTDYAVKLQGVDVKVTSSDSRLAMADRVAGVYDKIAGAITDQLRAFAYDVRPLLTEAQARVAKPIDLPLGDANGCAELRVLGVEAGPTIVADGIEKDVAILVAPSITLPCTTTSPDASAPSLPPLANVAALPTGPFTVTIPIAARYDELTRAMSAAFTDGKLFFSTTYPKLYLENPELYESEGELVLKLHIAGPVHGLGVDADLEGDLFLAGHPSVVDGELAVPDLEPTIETKNFLLSLKAMSDGDAIRDQARKALRLDLSPQLKAAREKLSSDLTFGAGSTGCFEGFVDRIEVKGVYPHAAYLRVYVDVTARARASLPCPPK